MTAVFGYASDRPQGALPEGHRAVRQIYWLNSLQNLLPPFYHRTLRDIY